MATGPWERFWAWLGTGVVRQEREALAQHDEPDLRTKFLSFDTLEVRLRVLTGVLLAYVVACGVTIVLPTPPIDLGGGTTIPWLSYVFSIASLAGGLTLLTLGLCEARWAGSVMIIAILVVIFATLRIGLFGPGEFGATGFGWLVFMAVWCVVCAGVAYVLRPFMQHGQLRWGVMIVFALFALSPLIPATVDTPVVYATVLIILRSPLVYLFLLAGADWAELNDTLARLTAKAAVLKDRPPLACNIIMGLSAALMFVILFTSPAQVIFVALVLPLVGGVLAATLWLARFDGSWPAHFSWPILALLVLSTVFGDVAIKHGVNLTVIYIVYMWVYAGLLIGAGQIGRAAAFGPPLLAALIFSVFSFCSLVIIPQPPTEEMWLGARGVYLGLAAMAFGGALYLRLRKSASPPSGEPALLLFVFTGGLILLFMLWAFIYALMRSTEEQAVTIACLLLIATVVWDILASGGSITNADGPLFPRRSRVYLFYGFVLLTLATVLYWEALIPPSQYQATIENLGDADFYVQVGVAAYGSAVVTALFVLRLGAWLKRTRDGATSATH